MLSAPETRRGGELPRPPTSWAPLLATLLLVVLAVVFWKLRVIDTAHITTLRGVDPRSTGSVDIHIEHFPMAKYGFQRLASGALPLWNPYQLCGVPFLAVPHTGVLYPPNLVYLILETGLATELSFVLHLAFAGVCLWLLMRRLRLSALGAFCASLTFMWSGWMIYYANQPSLLAGMAWLPATLLLLERSLHGSRAAGVGLALAVAFQLLNGAVEFLLYNLYAAGAFTLASCWGRPRPWRWLAWRAVGLAACVGVGVLLASAQLWPSLELVAEGTRAPGGLSLEAALHQGTIAPGEFVGNALANAGMVAVGVLPIGAIALGIGFRPTRRLWWFALITGTLATLLAFGGSVFELYFLTPLGELFRRPHKFLHLYAFAASCMTAIALTRLEAWRSSRHGGRGLWGSPAWTLSLASVGAAIGWLAWRGTSSLSLAASLVLLAVFGLTRHPRLRAGVILALALMQGVSLFFASSVSHLRPAARPDIFDRDQDLLTGIRERVGPDRVYIAPSLLLRPELTAKQGVLREIRVTQDYEPLSTRRYGEFFERASGRSWADPWAGYYALGPTSRWELMDLTSTRLYLVHTGDALDRFLSAAVREPAQADFELIEKAGRVRLYERRHALPRAYHVIGARVLAEPRAVLAALDVPGFDPRREVLLEAGSDPAAPRTLASVARATTRIQIDEPERLVVDVDADSPGFLVVTDAWYPGWRASIEGHDVPIHRANYLFRAVEVGSGRTRVTFEYRPRAFRIGLWVSAGTAALLVAFAAVVWRSSYRSTTQDSRRLAP